MLVLKQNNAGFVDLDLIPNVAIVIVHGSCQIEGVSHAGQHFWLGTYASNEQANDVMMQLYAAKKAHYNDFVMPTYSKKVCDNPDYCDI